MKITIILFFIIAIMLFIAGCGPGEPFEIEGKHSPDTETPTHLVAAK